MNKKFKMALISFSFLIIGGLLIVCSNKKQENVKSEEKVNTENKKVILSGYEFEIPYYYSVKTDDSINAFCEKENSTIIINVDDEVLHNGLPITSSSDALHYLVTEYIYKNYDEISYEYFEEEHSCIWFGKNKEVNINVVCIIYPLTQTDEIAVATLACKDKELCDPILHDFITAAFTAKKVD